MRASIFAMGVIALGSPTADAQDASEARLGASATWSEADVIARVRAGNTDVRSAEVHEARTRAASEGIGLAENPAIAWERQQAFDPNAQSQDLVRIIVPIDLSSRRRAQRELHQVEVATDRAATVVIRDEAVRDAVVLFYRAVAADRRAEVRADEVESLNEAVRVMASRETAGDGSGYSSSRIAVALELARSELAEARIEADALRESLGALAGTDPPAAVDGELEVDAPAPVDALIETARAQRDELAALDEALGSAERAVRAGRRAGFPHIELSAGYNRQVGPLVGQGYLVSAQLEIPLFDRGQGERAEAAAASTGLQAQRDALMAHIRAHTTAEHARLGGLLQERARFAQATLEPLATLLRATESGYREGVRSVVELLDARRAAVSVRDRDISLALSARLSDVRLRRVTGELR